MGFNHWKIIMNITKIEKEVYSWDAAVDVSRDAAIKFAYDILAVCDVNPLQPIKGKNNIVTLLELDLLNNIKDGNLKYKFIDRLETYDDALQYSKDGWRIPTPVDILNIRYKLYDILGDKLFTLNLWTCHVAAPDIGYIASIRFYERDDTIDFIMTKKPTNLNNVIMVKDLS